VPFNSTSNAEEEVCRLMSHFAPAPLILHDVEHGPMERFYVSPLFLNLKKRRKLSRMYGFGVRQMGKKFRLNTTNSNGEGSDPGSDAHVALIERAIPTRLAAHPEIARALLATAPRPIVLETGFSEPPEKFAAADVFCRHGSCRIRRSLSGL
jgi:hypothetical protein